jgi:hypothetical protein
MPARRPALSLGSPPEWTTSVGNQLRRADATTVDARECFAEIVELGDIPLLLMTDLAMDGTSGIVERLEPCL